MYVYCILCNSVDIKDSMSFEPMIFPSCFSLYIMKINDRNTHIKSTDIIVKVGLGNPCRHCTCRHCE